MKKYLENNVNFDVDMNLLHDKIDEMPWIYFVNILSELHNKPVSTEEFATE